MKQLIIALVLGCLMIPSMMQAQNDTRTDRIALCKENYTASMEHMHCLFQYAFL